MESDISAVTQMLRSVFVEADQVRARQMVADWPPEGAGGTAPIPKTLPVITCLSDAAKNAPDKTAPLVNMLAQTAHQLTWEQTYSTNDLSQTFLDRYGWTLLVGPNAPTECDSLLAGVLLLGAGIEYPPHQHAAEEVYVVLSGVASWKIGASDWLCRPAGSTIYNPPWQSHGMRTDQGQPLLLGFAWRAGRSEKSIFSNPETTETAG